MKDKTITTNTKIAVGVAVVVAIVIAFVLYGSDANAQTTSAGAVAGSQSQSGAQAGAVGIQINTPGSGGGAGVTGTGGAAGNTSVLSPRSLGLGISGGGSSRASSSASPTIVVGSGNIYEAADLSESVPAVFVPALTTSNGTCANSFSVGGTGPGFGFALGKTYVSGPCNARFNSNQLNSLGQQALALETMCGIKSVFEADLRMAEQYGSIPVCAQGAPDEGASTTALGPDTPDVVWFDDKEIDEVNELAANDQMMYDIGMNLRPIAPKFSMGER